MSYDDFLMVSIGQTEPTTTPLLQRIIKRIKGILRPYKKKVSLGFSVIGNMVIPLKVERNIYGLIRLRYSKFVATLVGEKNYRLLLELLSDDDGE